MKTLECQKNGKLYPVEYSNAITLYVHIDDIDFCMTPAGLMLVSKPEIFYRFEFMQISLIGLEVVNLKDFILEQYFEIAKKEMEDYLEEHLFDYSIYTDEFSVWPNLLDSLSTYQPSLGSDYTLGGQLKLKKGAMTIESPFNDRYVFEYNLINHKYESTHHPKGEDKCMDMAYCDYKKREMLALRQLEIGCVPRAVFEVLRIKQFLNVKKSIKVVFKDGTVIQLRGYHRKDFVDIRSILKVVIVENKPCFKIINSFGKSQEPETLQLDEVEHLQYRNEKFYINIEALNGADAMLSLETEQGITKFAELAQFVIVK